MIEFEEIKDLVKNITPRSNKFARPTSKNINIENILSTLNEINFELNSLEQKNTKDLKIKSIEAKDQKRQELIDKVLRNQKVQKPRITSLNNKIEQFNQIKQNQKQQETGTKTIEDVKVESFDLGEVKKGSMVEKLQLIRTTTTVQTIPQRSL